MGLRCFGASVAGPGHVRDGLPNQDAWSHAAAAGGRVVVVADGMGSRPLADIGARAACGAVPEAVRAWARHPGADASLLLGLVHLFWRARLGSCAPDQAATTCLFAFMRGDGSGVVAQLGDGVILMRDPDGVRPLQERGADSFTNTTLALGITKSIGAWSTRILAPSCRSVVLCSDGVADDLLPDRYRDFVGWLEGEISPLPVATRRRRLARELDRWPTPGHIDDKTLAYLARSA
jgi:serine/threonine protein phosphatase PrpC